jgi:hypothetical protein
MSVHLLEVLAVERYSQYLDSPNREWIPVEESSDMGERGTVIREVGEPARRDDVGYMGLSSTCWGLSTKSSGLGYANARQNTISMRPRKLSK